MALCTPWIDGEDVLACCSVETSSGVIFDQVATEASDLLFELSGRLFAGECEKTVRPCRTTCHCGWQVLSRTVFGARVVDTQSGRAALRAETTT